MQCGCLELRGLLAAGRVRYAHCCVALNLGLQACATMRGPSRAKSGGMSNSEVPWIVREQLELVGHPAELGKRTGLHLSHRPAAMNFYRSLGNSHIAGNLLAEAAAYDLKHN